MTPNTIPPYFLISELQELKSIFYEIFGFGITHCIDTLPSIWCGQVVVDIVDFDSSFRKEYSCEDLYSLNEIVERYCGTRGTELLNAITLYNFKQN